MVALQGGDVAFGVVKTKDPPLPQLFLLTSLTIKYLKRWADELCIGTRDRKHSRYTRPPELWVTPHRSKICCCLLRECDTCHTHHQVRDSKQRLTMLGGEEWQGSLAMFPSNSFLQDAGRNTMRLKLNLSNVCANFDLFLKSICVSRIMCFRCGCF